MPSTTSDGARAIQKPMKKAAGSKKSSTAKKSSTSSSSCSSSSSTSSSTSSASSLSKQSLDKLWSQWTPAEQKILASLDSPGKIQQFLDAMDYDPEDGCRSIRQTLQSRQAHCLGGCLLAYYCMKRLGYKDVFCIGLDAVNDDSHALCVYSVKVAGSKGRAAQTKFYGALSKSNFSTLRSRDCVYRSVRELVMSYWDFYFNMRGEKALTTYSSKFDPLESFAGVVGKEGRYQWLFGTNDAPELEAAFEESETNLFIPEGYDTRREGRRPEKKSQFGQTVFVAPKVLLDGSTMDSNPDGLYQPT
ncbi:unnamed protein product [Amoebophrya sp. A25]|nr:unnamed protein product [Amoebophrya sp. A25]|eukprot:GSA25T00009047001.1